MPELLLLYVDTVREPQFLQTQFRNLCYCRYSSKTLLFVNPHSEQLSSPEPYLFWITSITIVAADPFPEPLLLHRRFQFNNQERWLNGSTPDCKSVVLGSNPAPPQHTANSVSPEVGSHLG